MNIELDETPYDKKNFNSIFNKTHVIRKIVIEEFSPPNDVVFKFDKVICLTRDNSVETAISFIVAKKSDKWHVDYDVTTEWIIENRNEILHRKSWYDRMKFNLKKFKVLQVKYENIYFNKTDVSLLINYLNIPNPKHLHMLDNDKKYRKDTIKLSHDSERRSII